MVSDKVIPLLLLLDVFVHKSTKQKRIVYTRALFSDEMKNSKIAEGSGNREKNLAGFGILSKTCAGKRDFKIPLRTLLTVSCQKLITYLKRVATIHFFGSMLRNIHFFLRNIFLE